MAMNKTIKWLLIVVIIFIALILIILAVQYFNKSTTPPPSNSNPPSNVGSGIKDILSNLHTPQWLKNLFGGGTAAPACQPNNTGFDNNGYYTRACGGIPGGGGANCDPDNPGKDMNGFISSQCGG